MEYESVIVHQTVHLTTILYTRYLNTRHETNFISVLFVFGQIAHSSLFGFIVGTPALNFVMMKTLQNCLLRLNVFQVLKLKSTNLCIYTFIFYLHSWHAVWSLSQ